MRSENFDRGWNEALEAVLGRLHEEGVYGGDEIRNIILKPLKRPQPPVQQDDHTMDAAAYVKAAPYKGGSPAPFDIELRAQHLLPIEIQGLNARDAAVRLAREAQQATAEEIAREIDGINRSAPRRAVEEHCAAIARSHARPPQPAPETIDLMYPALCRYMDEWARKRPTQDIARQWRELKDRIVSMEKP